LVTTRIGGELVNGRALRSGVDLAAEAGAAFLVSGAAFSLLGAVAGPVRHRHVVIFILGAGYVCIVLVVARWRGPSYAVPLAIAGGLAFDSFYIPPIRPFGADHWQNWLVMSIYIAMGVLIGIIGAHTSRRGTVAEQAREILAEEQSALRRVATLVAHEPPPEQVFAKVAEEVALLLGVEDTAMLRYAPGGTATIVGCWGEIGDTFPAGTVVELEEGSVAGRVCRTLRPVRIDDYARGRGSVVAALGRLGVRSMVGAPVVVAGELWGVVVVASRRAEPLPAGTESRIGEFTELAATAVANMQARSDLAASRARIVAATDETRRRFERDLHDGVQQRLVSLALELRGSEAMVPPDRGELRASLSRVGDELAGVLDDLRELSRGIHPAILSEGGLGPALRALARRSAVPIQLDVEVGRRLGERLEAAAYYVVSEALTNAAKHARASVAEIHVAARDGALDLTVRDDGVGGADPGGGSGLTGLKDRVEALGGTLEIASPAGAGTEVHAELPID
jgi:signal transduction histidine kinase